MSLLRFRSLTYTYPGAALPALRDVDLDIDGGLVLIAGDSGSGKSTLLRVCNGLIPHFHGGTIGGSAVVCGHDVARTATRELANDVGFVFQDPELQAVYPRVERDVAFGLENLRVTPREMRSRVDTALEVCGVAHLRDRAIPTLSGGERQRVALAGVLAMRPRLLALDEPLSQLDDDGAHGLLSALDVLRRNGTAVLVAEHRRRLVDAHADRFFALERGTLRDSELTLSLSPLNGHGRDQRATPSANGGSSGWALHGVTAGHGRVAVLYDVDCSSVSGEVIALVGPNGSGKTTLLRTIAGLLPPLAGRVERGPGRIALLPQNPTSLLHRATVRAEIEWTLRHDRGGDAGELLRAFDLMPVADRYPRDLSTGERQRVALA
ncbi:MAG: ABC transporter ATP-binding protein, partial [Candidatus Dormibacteraeota bacterium]|nr:ABC transporter ATP-binding protein [Candidatus Dormibacteraeota bacterium]